MGFILETVGSYTITVFQMISAFLFICALVYLYFNRQISPKVFKYVVLAKFVSIVIFIFTSFIFAVLGLILGSFGYFGHWGGAVYYWITLCLLLFAYIIISFKVMNFFLKKYFQCIELLPQIIFGLLLCSFWYIPLAILLTMQKQNPWLF